MWRMGASCAPCSTHAREDGPPGVEARDRLAPHLGRVVGAAEHDEVVAIGALLEIGDLRGVHHAALEPQRDLAARRQDRKSTRLNSSHRTISYAVFCLKK